MRILVLTSLALVAFAANSVLVRSALAYGHIDPATFGGVRLLAGTLMLAVIVAVRGHGWLAFAQINFGSSAALLVYVAGFSFAYVSLETGTGALILFGGVQVTMFAGALLKGEQPGKARWAGAGLGMLGLAILFGPTAQQPDTGGAVLMGLAAVGWGIYSLRGQRGNAPIEATAANFALATPVALLLVWLLPVDIYANPEGLLLAAASGALASGVGYALWYSVLPSLTTT